MKRFAPLALACALGLVLGVTIAPGLRELVPTGAAGAADLAAQATPPVSAAPASISAVGRLEPEDGLYDVAGPSAPAVVIARLAVDEGDRVAAGDLLATLDTVSPLRAKVARLAAELAHAKSERERGDQLHRDRFLSDSMREARETEVRVLEAGLREARAELERAHVRAPVDGQVIEVHARDGERVGPEGILSIGRTDRMFAIAEVYETDAGRVRAGQRAVVTSPALPGPLLGKVERVDLQIGKQDLLRTDPAALKDARVVEVEIRLDESGPAAAFTNLQVEVEIDP